MHGKTNSGRKWSKGETWVEKIRYDYKTGTKTSTSFGPTRDGSEFLL